MCFVIVVCFFFLCFLFFFFLFLFFIVVIFCYVSLTVSEVKLFVRLTLFCFCIVLFFHLFIAYKLLLVDKHITILCIFILSRIHFCLNQILTENTKEQHKRDRSCNRCFCPSVRVGDSSNTVSDFITKLTPTLSHVSCNFGQYRRLSFLCVSPKEKYLI